MEYFTHSWDFKITTGSQVFLQFYQVKVIQMVLVLTEITWEVSLTISWEKAVILQSQFLLTSFYSFAFHPADDYHVKYNFPSQKIRKKREGGGGGREGGGGGRERERDLNIVTVDPRLD